MIFYFKNKMNIYQEFVIFIWMEEYIGVQILIYVNYHLIAMINYLRKI